MVAAIRKTEELIKNLQPEDLSLKVCAMVPLLNNLVLQIKHDQWKETHPARLVKVTKLISYGRLAHIIYSPFMIKALSYLSFSSKLQALTSIAFLYALSEKHIEQIKDQKSPEHLQPSP